MLRRSFCNNYNSAISLSILPTLQGCLSVLGVYIVHNILGSVLSIYIDELECCFLISLFARQSAPCPTTHKGVTGHGTNQTIQSVAPMVWFVLIPHIINTILIE